MEDSSNTADPADNSWLLSHLPSLPCFGDFYPHISSSLRSACQVKYLIVLSVLIMSFRAVTKKGPKLRELS